MTVICQWVLALLHSHLSSEAVLIDAVCFSERLYGNCSFVSTTAAVDKPIGNNSCFTMVMTNCFCAQFQTNNCHIVVALLLDIW